MVEAKITNKMITDYNELREIIQTYRFLCEPQNEMLKNMIINAQYDTDEVKEFAENYPYPLENLTLYMKDEKAITVPHINLINEIVHLDKNGRHDISWQCEELLFKAASYIVLLDMEINLFENPFENKTSLRASAADCMLNVINKFNTKDSYGVDALVSSYLFDISSNFEIDTDKGKIYLPENSIEKELNNVLKALDAIKDDKVTVAQAKFNVMYKMATIHEKAKSREVARQNDEKNGYENR